MEAAISVAVSDLAGAQSVTVIVGANKMAINIAQRVWCRKLTISVVEY